MAKDSVCGMDLDENAKFWLEHMGKTYYFCNTAYIERFKANSNTYMRK